MTAQTQSCGFAASEFAQRRERFSAQLAEAGLDGAAILRPELVYYLAGVEPYPGETAALLMRGDRALLVWPADPPAELAVGVEAISYDPYAGARHSNEGFEALAETGAERLGLRSYRVGVDAATQPRWLSADTADASRLLVELTRTKSHREVEALRINLGMNDAAFAAVGERFTAGCSDFDVWSWCCSAIARAAGEPIAYAGNIGLGARGDYFDAQPGGTVAREGDCVFVDLYCRIGHYVGDSTRSFSAGPAPRWLRDAHERLEQTLDAIEPAIRPGAVAGDIDRRCRALVDAEGQGGAFPHHTGHGVGLRAHEPPYLVPGSLDELRSGDVVAVEPGIYFKGRGGARLEEVYLVTDDGPLALTGSARRLTQCPT